jgi:hypothetical protein
MNMRTMSLGRTPFASPAATKLPALTPTYTSSSLKSTPSTASASAASAPIS